LFELFGIVFDYVAEGGLAGCVDAARPSENPDARVASIESDNKKRYKEPD
jgi:hypothetical protein